MIIVVVLAGISGTGTRLWKVTNRLSWLLTGVGTTADAVECGRSVVYVYNFTKISAILYSNGQTVSAGVRILSFFPGVPDVCIFHNPRVEKATASRLLLWKSECQGDADSFRESCTIDPLISGARKMLKKQSLSVMRLGNTVKRTRKEQFSMKCSGLFPGKSFAR